MNNNRYNFTLLILFPFLVVSIILANTPLDKSQWKKNKFHGNNPKENAG